MACIEQPADKQRGVCLDEGFASGHFYQIAPQPPNPFHNFRDFHKPALFVRVARIAVSAP
jgi:hypothetical protein